jgi:hypothetical protein
MARIPFPTIHGIERVTAGLKGPYNGSYCLELKLDGEGDETVRADFWFSDRAYAEELCDAINAASPSETEG